MGRRSGAGDRDRPQSIGSAQPEPDRGHFKPGSSLVDEVVASPNFGPRNGTPDTLILHYTGMASGRLALEHLCDPAAQVSCHYLVWEDGRIAQLVPESGRAWHAGVSAWQGQRDMNSRSIGVEIVNAGHPGGLPPYPAAQIDAVVALSRDICRRHAIAPWNVLGHSDIAPGRKIDPGEAFPWARLHAGGVGHWVDPAPASIVTGLGTGDSGDAVADLQRHLASYGYDLPVTRIYDTRTEVVVAAFQRHFRPARVDGIADASTRTTLDRLIEARSSGAKRN